MVLSARRGVACVALALATLCLAHGVGPPAPSGKLAPRRQAHVQALQVRLTTVAYAGEMGRALRLAQEIESLHRQWQGARHLATVNAGYQVEMLGRLAPLRPEAQAAVGRAWRLRAQGHALQAQRHYARAEALHRQAVAVLYKAVGEEHPETAMSCYNVATAMRAQGKAEQAQPLYLAALVIYRKTVGEAHPFTAHAHLGLGACLSDQGKYRPAQANFERALVSYRKALGEDHDFTTQARTELAHALQTQGQAARALPLFEQVLASRRRAHGEGAPITAQGYNNVAYCLDALGQHARAQPLHEKALAIRTKVLGENASLTAQSYNNLAFCLQNQGRPAQARPLHEKALAIRKKVQGDDHPETASSYGHLAICLLALGKPAEAQPLAEKALAIKKKALGDDHPETALSYDNVAVCLSNQRKYARALPLYEKALAIRLDALGELHPLTAMTYNNLAHCLAAMGQGVRAQGLFEKARGIFQKTLGENHPQTLASVSNLAFSLSARDQFARARPLHEGTLAARRKALGEEHPDTAASYHDLAACFAALGKHDEARGLYERALRIRRKALGELHPATAQTYDNLGSCLREGGRIAAAQGMYEKALAIRKTVLGEEHPDTAHSANHVAYCLYDRGRHREAIAQWHRALLGHDHGRLIRAESGFTRARTGARQLTPRRGLVLAHARLREPEKAWQYAEADLARNLLDDLAGAAPEQTAALAELRNLEERLTPLFGRGPSKLREELVQQRREVLRRLAKSAADRSAALVWPLERIQEQLPDDGALVLWAGDRMEMWGCVLRRSGPPRWQSLAGSGPGGSWAGADYALAASLFQALLEVGGNPARRRERTEAVRKRWWAPLEKHLAAEGKLPAVRRLFVVPSYGMAAVPVELLAPGYTVSYIPSATLLARARKDRQALRAAPALVLGDPNFQAPAPPPLPPYGVLVARVAPNGAAHKAGLRDGDVLLRYDGVKLQNTSDLLAALRKNRKGEAVLWRAGKEITIAPPLPVDFQVHRRPAPQALRALRGDAPAERVPPLPGTRAEVQALAALLGKECRALLGSEASEQALEARGKELKTYRVLHFATHGALNLTEPERSRLLLARDKLPPWSVNTERAARGLKPLTGELTVATILREWKLDADLVVLSACVTGLGAESSGDGLLGFPYALLRVGARSVVLSRWKVDDVATALLMVRFYENLLGKAQGLKKPMGRAEALAEAKQWLRELPKKDAEKLAIALSANKLSGTRGSIVELNVKEKPKLPSGDRPYEHPFFWAAFVLVGDPE